MFTFVIKAEGCYHMKFFNGKKYNTVLQHISIEDLENDSILHLVSTFKILKNRTILYTLDQGHLSVFSISIFLVEEIC